MFNMDDCGSASQRFSLNLNEESKIIDKLDLILELTKFFQTSWVHESVKHLINSEFCMNVLFLS